MNYRAVSTPEGAQARQLMDANGNPAGPVEYAWHNPMMGWDGVSFAGINEGGNVQWGTTPPNSSGPWSMMSATSSDFMNGSDLMQIGAMAASVWGPQFLSSMGAESLIAADMAGGMVPQFGTHAGYAAGMGAGAGATAGTMAGIDLATEAAALGDATGSAMTGGAPTAAQAAAAATPVGAATPAAGGAASVGTTAATTAAGVAGGKAAAGGGFGASLDRIASGNGTIGDYGSILLGAGAPLAGAFIQGNAAERAAGTQALATAGATQELRRQYDQTREDTAPYRVQGQAAIGELGKRTMAGGDLNRPFTVADFWADPVVKLSHQAGLDSGTKSLYNRAPLTTGHDSGAAMKELVKFNTDYTGGMATASHDRFMGDQSNQFNRLASLAGIGQTSVGQTTAAGNSTATSAANLISGGGDARGASQIAQGNALQGALGSISNWWQGQDTLDKLLRARGGGYAGAY